MKSKLIIVEFNKKERAMEAGEEQKKLRDILPWENYF
jgi:hypothetical protein